jgi:hypothetical protein
MKTDIGESSLEAEPSTLSQRVEDQPLMVVVVPEKKDTFLFASKSRDILVSFVSGFTVGCEMQFDFNGYISSLNEELDRREKLN